MEHLDAQIKDDSGLDEPALEELRVERKQKVKKIADTNKRLMVSGSAGRCRSTSDYVVMNCI